MTDKAIEAATTAVQKALNDELDWCSREGGHIDGGRAARAAIAAYEASLGPLNPGPIADMVNENTRLRAQVERMREALRPFSEAAYRINYYNGEHYNAPLFALSGDVLTELLDGFEGKRMTVSHLRAARAAMEG